VDAIQEDTTREIAALLMGIIIEADLLLMIESVPLEVVALRAVEVGIVVAVGVGMSIGVEALVTYGEERGSLEHHHRTSIQHLNTGPSLCHLDSSSMKWVCREGVIRILDRCQSDNITIIIILRLDKCNSFEFL